MIGSLEMALKPNERIVYSYEHSLNSKSKTIIRKQGVFVRKVNHPRKYWTIFHRQQMAIVMLDGNRNESRVRIDQLRKEE